MIGALLRRLAWSVLVVWFVVTATFDGKKMETVNFARVGSDVFASRSDEPGAAKLEASGLDEATKALDAIK